MPKNTAAIWIGHLLLSTILVGQQGVGPAKAPQKRTRVALDVEDSVGGFRTGDPLRKARSRFPTLRQDGDDWHGQVGPLCELSLGSSDSVIRGKPLGNDDPVETIVLSITGAGELAQDPVCGGLQTGRGLRISGSFETAKEVYPDATISTSKDKYIIWHDNGPDCLSGRTSILRSLRIFYSADGRRLTDIIIDASKTSCLDFRAGGGRH